MHRKEKDGMVWWEFEQLAGFPLRHGVFSRRGGVSPAPFASLNVSHSSGDDPENVKANRRKIQGLLELEVLKDAHQCHGKAVLKVKKDERESSESYDALITDEPSVGLLIKHGDCQVAIIYDPKRHVVANVHSGWRGSVQNIYAESIKSLVEVYGCRPEDLLVCIGPSLGPESAQFIHYKEEFPQHFWPFQIRPHYFDFWEISRMQLTEAGVMPHHIEVASMDTVVLEDDFFSYRRDRTQGRNATVVSLL